MRTRILASTLALFCFSLPALALGERGNGFLRSETREVGAFRSIDFSGVGTLTVQKGPWVRVEIQLDSNLLPHYRSEVREGRLELGFEPGFILTGLTRLEVRVTMPALEGLALSGTANAIVARGFSGSLLLLQLSGAGRLEGDLDFDRTVAGVSGTGTMRLSGRSDRLELELSGASAFEGAGFESAEARVGLSGSARADLRVSTRLEATLSGAADLRWYGNPSVELRSSGSARARRVGD